MSKTNPELLELQRLQREKDSAPFEERRRILQQERLQGMAHSVGAEAITDLAVIIPVPESQTPQF